MTTMHRLLVRLVAGLVLAALAGGVPAALALLIGWPLPDHVPSLDEVTVVLSSPPSQRLVLHTLAVIVWVVWAAFVGSLASELASAARHGLATRHTRSGWNPMRGLALVLFTALATGSLGHMATATVAGFHQPASVEVMITETPVARQPPATPAADGAAVAQADPPRAVARAALWQDPPSVLADPTTPGSVVLQAGQRQQRVEVAASETLWNVAEAWLGDPRRWPEIAALNPDDHGPPASAELVLLLPDDATVPGADQTPATTAAPDADPDPDDDPDADAAPVYEVVAGDWLWHIADRYLGDPQRYREIAELNPQWQGRQATHPDGHQLTYPDLIMPGWQLELPGDAEDQGPRAHATGELATGTPPAAAPPDPEPPRPDPEPPADPQPPAGPEPPVAGPSPALPPTPGQREPDGVVPTPGTTPPAQTPPAGVPAPGATVPPPAPSGPPATTAAPQSPSPQSPAPQPSASQETGPPPADDQPPAGDQDGVGLPDGTWVPWALAAAVAAAMGVVWLQRRRRYQPRRIDGTDEFDQLADTPAVAGQRPVVARLLHALRLRPQPAQADPPEQAISEQAAEPSPGDRPDPAAPDRPPASATEEVPATAGPEALPQVGRPVPGGGGVALVGPGAAAAARGALVAALSAGGPTDPDAQTEVVTPADTMVTLLGAEAVTLGSWGRLRVVADLDAALAVVESRLLAGARLLDEYEVTDVATLRQVAPAEQPVPPMLLISVSPPAELRMRTRTVLGLGGGLEVSALLLGAWEPGPTLHVETDGTCRPAGGGTAAPFGATERMAVVEPAAALELLHTLREAHTGDPPPAGSADPIVAASPERPATPTTGESDVVVDVDDDEKARLVAGNGHSPTPPAVTPAAASASVHVLGVPEIAGGDAAGRPLRKAAVELLVFLAVHRDGAEPDRIQEAMWPDNRRRLAATKLHTAASNLRHILAAAAGGEADPGHYLRKHKGRYQLAAVNVDLWTLQEACAEAGRSGDPTQRALLLRRACTAYRGELAAGRDYEWITADREAARMLALDAHTSLADQLADTDPPEAARLWLRATEIDPMAESVCQQAMRACHRIGDGDTIRTLLRRLATHLDEIGAEPAETTVELADRLRADIGRPGSGA